MAFVKGKSGNPSGRPAGAGRVAKLRAMLEPEAPALIQAAITAAKGGDMIAMRLCLDRCVPVLKAVTEAAPLSVDLSGTAVQQSQAILTAVSDGVLSIEEATQLLAGIASSMKILEISEMEKRLEALEEAAGQGGRQ